VCVYVCARRKHVLHMKRLQTAEDMRQSLLLEKRQLADELEQFHARADSEIPVSGVDHSVFLCP
jgi:hypothetical protein